jgi:histidinol-phosphate aminotransferase
MEALVDSNRYPDNDLWDLSHALAEELGVDRSNLLFGNGSVALLADIANSVGGPGTGAVYGWPSFVMYRFAAIWSGTEFYEVPLREDFTLDLASMSNAVNDATRVVFLCHPNNPTGTITPSDEVEAFIDTMPDSVLVVVDEAYHEFVEDPRYRSAVPIALENPHVLVLRTFSKIYGLAAHRVGYAVGHSETLSEIRKAQQPLTVNQVAQAAALASLGQPAELERRARRNAAARHHLLGALAEREIRYGESQTNFIFFRMGEDSNNVSDEFTKRGVIIRGMSDGWVRVTIGSEAENQRFLEVLDELLEAGLG